MSNLNHLGAEQAESIRTAARQLAEIENLRDTSSLREIFYDLGEALDDLTEPLEQLLDVFDEIHGGAFQADMPDLSDLRAVVNGLRHCANNL